MDETLLQQLAWMDYRLAVIFTVMVPIALLIWSFVAKVESMQRLLGIYWKVASLLMVTVYLLIPSWSVGYLTGLLSRILIPIGLWFWIDLNEEIRDQPGSRLKLAFTAWRWAVTVYCALGAIANLPFLGCAFSTAMRQGAYCQVWLEAPSRYQQILHANSTPGFLGFLGIVGLVIYVVYLLTFLVFRLGRQGRIAIEE
ncbi:MULTISPECIES: DUF3177 family protein [Cyanophyceae]|uniref:DUF3177 family protein n=1 Tax=Cyanophyceae TaxID=3028117 RepID=UPI00016DC9AA|nr:MULTISPECIES: DUF3177 family protein [Cyanophyceae]ACA99263.1 conserved hypothetical membrain protein [Picosynechococcus sp. PCC 7002]SMH33114.1 Protein of unknown function [Picosynechococcus sp. OG1]SMQ84356.1 Protein of unknown function [Synechococcus sp. 7002]